MFLKKNDRDWFAPISSENVFAKVAGVVSTHGPLYLLHEHSADNERTCGEIGMALEASSCAHVSLHSFMSLSQSERDGFLGAIVASYETFTSVVVSQWLPQGLGRPSCPELPIVALGLDAIYDARVSRVFLPLQAQSVENEWREMHVVAKASWAWLSENGGADAALTRLGDDVYEVFYQYAKTIVGKDDANLRSVCYQSIHACIKSSQELIEGVHYAHVKNQVLWAGKDGTFHPSNIKEPVTCIVISAKLGIPPQRLNSNPEVIDVHPLSLLKAWKGQVFGTRNPASTLKPFTCKNETFRVSDSLKGQNILLQAFIRQHKGKNVFVLVNDRDYLAGLSIVPDGVVVLTHTSYMVMQAQSQSGLPVICLQMPRSERALYELVSTFLQQDVPYVFALCGHDGRLSEQGVEWLSLVTQFVMAPTARGERNLLRFWFAFWEKSKDHSARLGDQYRLDRIKLSTLSAAFDVAVGPLAQQGDEIEQLQEKAYSLGVSHLWSKVVEEKRTTPHLLWILFLIRVQESLLMHRLGSVMLPVQLSLSSEKTSHDMEEIKTWKSLTPHIKR